MITILKGDDTANLEIELVTESSLTGYSAEVEIGGKKWTFNDLSNGSLPFALSAEETEALGIGIHFVKVTFIAPDGKRSTCTNTMRLRITSIVQDVMNTSPNVSFIIDNYHNALAGETLNTDATENEVLTVLARMFRTLGGTTIGGQE